MRRGKHDILSTYNKYWPSAIVLEFSFQCQGVMELVALGEKTPMPHMHVSGLSCAPFIILSTSHFKRRPACVRNIYEQGYRGYMRISGIYMALP